MANTGRLIPHPEDGRPTGVWPESFVGGECSLGHEAVGQSLVWVDDEGRLTSNCHECEIFGFTRLRAVMPGDHQEMDLANFLRRMTDKWLADESAERVGSNQTRGRMLPHPEDGRPALVGLAIEGDCPVGHARYRPLIWVDDQGRLTVSCSECEINGFPRWRAPMSEEELRGLKMIDDLRRVTGKWLAERAAGDELADLEDEIVRLDNDPAGLASPASPNGEAVSVGAAPGGDEA